MAQWMHLYGVDVETFRLVVRTFLSVFPYVSLWADPDYPDVIFLGSDEPIRLDAVALDALFTGNDKVSASMARIGYPDAGSLFRAFLLEGDEVTRFAGSGTLNTDNLPLLEFRAPKSLYSRTALQDNVRAMLESKSPESFPVIDAEPAERGRAAVLLGEWASSLSERRMIANAKGALVRATEVNPSDPETFVHLGRARMQTGDLAGAAQSFEQAVALDSGRGDAHSNLGTLYLQAGDTQRAYVNLSRALALGNDSSGLRNNLAVVHAKSGRMEDAVREASQAVALDPGDRVARENLMNFQQRLEQR
jgi:tetratricopeptide (TPR) repeat protein